MKTTTHIILAMMPIMLWIGGTATASAQKSRKSHMRDSVTLSDVTITGKSKIQQLREGALTVNAVDIRSFAGSINNLNNIIDRTAGVKIREEGGLGSDFDLSINGMSGNAVRYFIDGIPLDVKGSGATLANLPISTIDHIEIYKGVVPVWLNSDALGGAINIVTNQRKSNYMDVSYGVGSFHTHKADFNAQYIFKNGLTIRPTLGFDYSKNDYTMKGVELWDEAVRKYLPQNRKRFHDDYLSFIGQMEVGVKDKWWTDEFFIGTSYLQTNKELQTGQVQTRVIGMAERNTTAWSIGARYQKRHFLTENLSANLSFSHTWDHSIATDTAHRQYDWNGDYIYSGRNEINGRNFQLRHIKRPTTVVRAELNYHLSDHHMFDFTYTMNRIGNHRWDEVDKEFTPANDVLAKHIIGLAYNQSLWQGRMYNTFFLKDYINHLSVEQTDLAFLTNSRDVKGSNTKNHFGGGIGTRLQILKLLTIKASYEHSTRLPLARELLGNGTTIYANMALKPESSDNLNIGLFGTLRSGQHTLFYEANGFLRYVDNYIQPQIAEKEGMMQYSNEPAVHIKGMEGEIRYDWDSRLQLIGNISWQDARNRLRYLDNGQRNATFNNRVPNRPWLFSSAEVRYTLKDVFQKNDHLSLCADHQWVHWFFLSWEAYGSKSTKARIPEKNIVGANATYTWHNRRYSISLDCENIFDATVYDNYKLQKPGRTLFAKFRLLLQ
ncbi:TonB-dependent receptor domain-containing protein [Xylanibacter brevis]|uniref:TonB-dependent receptor domain-containing protein n=1 Tax=Xylanibacter brevis TaxID=83231 RepID=UPI001E315F1E|nr:TonB-dependent receptor [Xylanibacter brevis]